MLEKKNAKNHGAVWLYRPKYDIKRIKWEINPSDSDTNPMWSVPHGDDIYPKYHTLKLNVDNGYIHTAKGQKLCGIVPQKELDRLHSDPQFQRVRERAIANHQTSKTKKVILHCSIYIIELKFQPIIIRRKFKCHR